MTSMLKTAALQCFDTILTNVGGGELVTNGSNSGRGVVRYSTDPELTGHAVREHVSGYCRVKYDEIGDVQYSQAIKIGTRTVYVSSIQIDAAGALLTFDFTSTSPANGLGI